MLKQALIFAAGLGERMRPLTNTTPKPLLPVGNKPLIEWHLERMQAIGIERVVVNTSWLAEQFPVVLGDGSTWGLQLTYSQEPYPPLETGGGMLNAWRYLDESAPLLAVNGDVWTDFDFATLPQMHANTLAHLVLVENPEHNKAGDFALTPNGQVTSDPENRLTFAGIGVYRHSMLDGWGSFAEPTQDHNLARFKLAPLLRQAMQHHAVTGQRHTGLWTDVGTPERLYALDAQLNAKR